MTTLSFPNDGYMLTVYTPRRAKCWSVFLGNLDRGPHYPDHTLRESLPNGQEFEITYYGEIPFEYPIIYHHVQKAFDLRLHLTEFVPILVMLVGWKGDMVDIWRKWKEYLTPTK